jgi:hypothetical protein
VLERGPHVTPGRAVLPAEDRALLLLAWQVRELIIDCPIHRHLAAPTGLRLGKLEHAAAEIDAVPGELEDLVLARA